MVRIVQSGAWSPGVNVVESETLLRLAWGTLRWQVGDRGGAFDFSAYTLTPALQEPRATFVTLHRKRRLRGCIGELVAREALYRSVHTNAIAAAAEDYRFEPLRAAELEGLDVAISILSPMEPIPSLAAFRVGEQGLVLERGRARAVFLPEVAVEQGWGPEATATQLCRKAGLADDAWRSGASFQVFWSAVLTGDAP
jgi:AmmeMemoRadiSam system protein A